MANFPVYDSSSNINPNIQAPEKKNSGQGWEDLQNLNKTVMGLTQQWSDRNDVMQETKAKTNAEIAFSQQEQAAHNDPNPDNAEMHLKAINDVVGTATKGIDNKEVAGQVGIDLEHAAFLTQMKIQDTFRNKQIFANDQRLDQLATTTASNVANPISAAAAQEDEDKFMSTVQANASRGLISPERANALVKQYKVGVVKNRISQSTSTNPSDYKDVDAGASLDLQEIAQKDKMVEAHIKEVKESNIASTFDNRLKVLGGVASKQLDWKSADKINQMAAQDPALGSALQMVFDAQVNNKEDYEPSSKEGQKYADSVNKLMTGMTKEQVSEYLPTAIEQISKLPAGEMQNRLAVLVNASEDRAKSLPIKDEQDIPPEVMKQEGGLQAVLRWNKEHGENDPQTLNDYLKNIHGGDAPSDAYNKAVKNKIVKDHPEVAAQKDVPNRIIGEDSKSFHIFSGQTIIYPARIWSESLGRFEINPNREESNDNGSQQTNE